MIYAQVPIDAGSLAEPFFAPDAKAFMHDAKAFGALAHSVKVDAAMAGQYDAVCLCGGHGTCVDFYGPAAAALKAVVEGTYAAGKVVGAVCHGPIGLCSCGVLYYLRVVRVGIACHVASMAPRVTPSTRSSRCPTQAMKKK